MYSGPTAAWAYKSIDIAGIRRVFILGPSHHIYLDRCALPTSVEYETPLGNLPLDLEVIGELRDTGHFGDLDNKDDENEHSIEMQLPYIRKIFDGKDICIVPILVGALPYGEQVKFGEILAPYLAKRDTVFVISSDFCHWGTRFSYTYYYPEYPPKERDPTQLSSRTGPSEANPIHQSIRQLDQQAMDILSLPPNTASTAHRDFLKYLTKTKNTICGKHPIGVLLGALSTLEKGGHQVTMNWVQYRQSSSCFTIRDSSVSYASGWVKF
ncbi:hypothetical protein AX16_009658 [Volvariella volvacea WC 439]|nr:hypothetical protein AX16_009658 [Volvariella volvacea WC 439]